MLSAASSNTALVAAGIAGTLFLGYCIYFDHKRRRDPLYKQKVRERRQKERKARRAAISLPNTNDANALQKFLLQELQMGETLLTMGDVEGGVEHLAAAVVVCEQPEQLLRVLNQSLPEEIMAMLVARLPTLSRELHVREIEEDVE